MDRPVIPPLTILPTAPETFSVLEQRMRVAEEQAESLISDLQALGVTSHRLTSAKFKISKSSEHIRPISPVRARPAFTGDGDTLWRNCENLVTRMCHMESMLHTLKLNVFRMHTDWELSTKNSGELEHRLLQMQEEHAQELKEAQLEVMRLRQRLNCAIEERKREMEAKERLSAALEIATTTKTDVAIAAEELKATKACMSQRLTKFQEKLSREAALRALLEEEQAVLLLTVQDMKNVVEKERTQIQELQQHCQKMNREGKEMKDKLEHAESRCQEAKKDNLRLQSEMEAKDSHVSQLQEEVKTIKQKCEVEQAELTQVQADHIALREAAEKVQCLNQQLENQCSELTGTVQKLTNQNLQLMTQHQQELKVGKEAMAQKLQEQKALLSAVQSSLGGEMQEMLSERTQLERELELLHNEHSKCKKKALHRDQKSTVQIAMQGNTIACLRSDLDSALQEKAAIENEKILLQEELYTTLNDFLEKKQNLEVQLTENKLEQESLRSSLWVQEQENKRLVERVAVLEQEQHAKRQVELLLNELTDSKNKLAYKNGKLQSTVEQLQSDLHSFGNVHSENSKLFKLNAALQSRHTQVNSELDSSKIRLQRLEAKLLQTEHLLRCKEEALALTVQARDEAVKEEKRLKQQIYTLEETGGNTKAALQQQLSEVCEERTRMSNTLQNVLSSHAKFQKDLETLQTELGRRDNDLLTLQKDRVRSQKHIEKLKAELLECNTRLHTAECQQRGEIEPLQKFIEVAREDNRKLARALDQTLQRNSTLQNHVHELKEELQNKELQEKQLLLNQTQAKEDYRIKEQLFEEQLVSLKKQHQVEKKEAKKATTKEVTELREALDSVTSKLTELSRRNRELRNRESMVEKETLHQQDLIRSLKTQHQSYIESKGVRRQSERIQDLEAELEHMNNNIKESYEKNNNKQCKHIPACMNEADSVRKKINAATSQDPKESTLQSQLEEEVTSRQSLEQRCKELEYRVHKLQEVKSGTELILRDASEESEQDFNKKKISPYLPPSLEHWEIKQNLKLISRNLLFKHKTS
ncbi:coiled-coil domain-containing protein 150 isoform X2 [Rhinoderma darwinii]|uniref:coiled-coil domain-containing protein 150 isoform X2 n=1 Tax=Rhinoderma darwinii TaxID=43563 RepID=UPI003F666AE5